MEDKMISIIVPVYNAEKYLDKCVESIIRQTYTNWELILVDDGSKDSSSEMCDKWSKTDPRIRVIHKTNGGLSSARNAGLEIAKGEYIGFVDADDYITEKMYSVLAEALQNTEKKMVSCASMQVFPSGETKPGSGISAPRDLDVTQGIRAILRGEIGIAVWSKLFERSMFDSIRFPEDGAYEDLPLMLPMLKESSGIYHTGLPLYNYVQHEGSITDLYWKNCADISLKRVKEFGDQFIANGLMKDFKREFTIFEAKSSYEVSIMLDKHYHELDEKGRMSLKAYIRIMRRGALTILTSDAMKVKHKILYMMIITRTLRPVYSLLGKK